MDKRIIVKSSKKWNSSKLGLSNLIKNLVKSLL